MSLEPMFTLQEVLPWLSGAQLIGDGTVPVQRVHTDTRSLQPGDLFVALKGERFDANAFLAQARSAGAAAALCSDAAALRQAGLPGIVVANTLDGTRRALGQLAAGWRQALARGHRLPLIAVTGSNGKTTVTQMTASILRAHKPQATLATEGNFNNDIGVPLTLLRLRRRHELAVVELGMNHPGEIAHLASMARPTVALVNNAQREHQEFMHGVEAVARENGAVIASLGAEGTAVYPSDDAYSGVWRELAGARARLTFSFDDTTADLHCAAAPTWRGDEQGGGWQVQARTPAGALNFRLRVAGQHNVRNALAAAACALAAGVPLAAIAKGLEAFEPVKGRSRALQVTLQGRALTVIDDTYNANPDSVRAAIDVLASLPGPRLLVLGDMGEVGNDGPRFHAEVGAYARERGIELLHTLGDMSEAASTAFTGGMHHGQDVDALNLVVLASLPQVQSVLVKGSRFMKMERVVQAIQAFAAVEKEKQDAASS